MVAWQPNAGAFFRESVVGWYGITRAPGHIAQGSSNAYQRNSEVVQRQ
jgi:hypothetical protein